jgi:hypothetical protein
MPAASRKQLPSSWSRLRSPSSIRTPRLKRLPSSSGGWHRYRARRLACPAYVPLRALIRKRSRYKELQAPSATAAASVRRAVTALVRPRCRSMAASQYYELAVARLKRTQPISARCSACCRATATTTARLDQGGDGGLPAGLGRRSGHARPAAAAAASPTRLHRRLRWRPSRRPWSVRHGSNDPGYRTGRWRPWQPSCGRQRHRRRPGLSQHLGAAEARSTQRHLLAAQAW